MQFKEIQKGRDAQKTFVSFEFLSAFLRLCVCALIIFFVSSVYSLQPSTGKVRTLYNSLDQLSIPQHLALYQLYPETKEGQEAARHAWALLRGSEVEENIYLPPEYVLDIAFQAIIQLVNKKSNQPVPELAEEQLIVIEQLGHKFPNRKLKGNQAQSEEEVLALPWQEIDLARGLFLTQLGNQEMRKIRTYEASIDLMALQILARLPKNATPEKKIRAINDYIFTEMGFRFPPHSTYANDIDLYTFLPSVLDSRRGVCLGVSILYICLAQRLQLNLEMITPPGHIYVRYREGNKIINIETTARGIHIDSEEYLGIETRSLQQRNIKDVIGLAHFNQASVYWTEGEYGKALAAYQKAEKYLPDDKLLQELMGYAYLLTGDKETAVDLLEKVRDHVPEHAIIGDNVADDFLSGRVDEEGIKAIFLAVDENRESIIKKQQAFEKVLEKYPNFRAGRFGLVIAWLQLHRHDKALSALEKYDEINPGDPTAEYYLMMLYAQRFDFPKAWNHFHRLEKLLESRNHRPKLLTEIKRELNLLSPD